MVTHIKAGIVTETTSHEGVNHDCDPSNLWSLSMEIYNLKFHSDGSLEKHKTRLVVKGYAQAEGLDYDETFAPIAQMVTICTMIAMAAHYKWPIYQMDVKYAFLYGDLNVD